MEPIYRFKPILKTVLWGGTLLSRLKGLKTQDHVGESWEISSLPGHISVVEGGSDDGLSLDALIDRYGAALVGADVYRRWGNRFPLLVKFIDAHARLSLQVHPDEAMAAAEGMDMGKTEAWHIVSNREGARLVIGFNHDITHKELEQRIADHTLLEAVTFYETHAGDTFFIPAGQVHMVDEGNLLVEVQQPADVTYRVYDHGRRDVNGKPRKLHLAEARRALDCRKNTSARVVPADGHLLKCDHFVMDELVATERPTAIPAGDTFTIITVTDGTLRVEASLPGEKPVTVMVPQATTVLLPAAAHASVTGPAHALLITP